MYARIFESIYDGSLRKDWKAMVVFQQLLVLADEEGMVVKTAEAISGRTGIPLDFIQYGLTELAKPDPSSKSKEEGGRRIVLVDPDRDWGWRIVNHRLYKGIKTTADLREYWSGQKRTYRETKTLERATKLKRNLEQLYNRKTSIVWAPVDEQALVDISRRESSEREFVELSRFKSVAEYFPQSISSLLEHWDRTLDRSRQQPNGKPRPVQNAITTC